MKISTVTVIAVASFALVSADAPCSDKLTAALTAASSNQAKCKTDSGFDITAEAPKAAILTKFCASQSCVALWKTVKALGLSECMIYDKHLNKELLNPAAAACPALAASSNTTTTTPSPSTKTPTASNSAATTTKTPATATPVSTTKAPTPTTKAPTTSSSATTPATTTKAPTASNATASNSTAAKTPAATVKAPTPSSSSGVSVLTLSAGAVVLAVATSFF